MKSKTKSFTGRLPKRQLKRTHALMEALLGTPKKGSKHFSKVIAALNAGATDIPVEIPWYDDGGFHQILLQRLVGDRVYFLNPLPRKGTTSLGKLPRRPEPDGLESALLMDLEQVFNLGNGTALLPEA